MMEWRTEWLNEMALYKSTRRDGPSGARPMVKRPEWTCGGTVRLCFTRVKVTVFLAVDQGDNGHSPQPK